MRTRLHSLRRAAKRGFTLIEVAIAIVIVSVGIVAVEGMVATSARTTAYNDELQTGGMLCRAMNERCLNFDRAALLALNGITYTPPLDSEGNALTELSSYTQRIDVQRVDPINITGTTTDDTTGLLRVIVSVSRHGHAVTNSQRLLATTKQDP